MDPRHPSPLATLAASLICLVLTSCTAPVPPGGLERLMKVSDVRVDPRTSSPVILLREEEGAQRRLPIWIGIAEARSIALAMERVDSPRPNSHDLIQNILEEMGTRVSRVVITELKGGTYYAVLELERDGKQSRVDSRPSDAIAVAMRTGTSVYASESVLARAGVLPDEDGLDIDWDRARDADPLVH